MKKPIRFGSYLLLERANVGGMAEVYKAAAPAADGSVQRVALKRILPSVAEDPEFVTMFLDEARIAQSLEHPNIARTLDVGRVNDDYYIAMEYVAGRDMRAVFDRMRKRGEVLPLGLTLHVVCKVCEALAHAHELRDALGRPLELVHRDVSLQNILVSYEGDVKIIDFGIAKSANKVGKTQTGILKGKYGYMSPEQVAGLPLDRRSDVFGVGICLYEMLTGERLFEGESDFATLELVRNVRIQPPTAWNPRIPPEVEAVVLRALARDRDRRYASTLELRRDLLAHLQAQGDRTGRAELAAFMQRTFATEIAREREREEQLRQQEAGRRGVLSALHRLPTPSNPPAPGPALAASISKPPMPNPPKPPHRPHKSTIVGMGAVVPPTPMDELPTQVPRPSVAPSAARPLVPAAPRHVSMPPPPPPPAAAAPSAPRTPVAPPPGPGAHGLEWEEDDQATQIYDRDPSELMDELATAQAPVRTPVVPAPEPRVSASPGADALPAIPRPAKVPMPKRAAEGGNTPARVPLPRRDSLIPQEQTAVMDRPAPPRSNLGVVVGALSVVLVLLVVGGWLVLRPAEPGTLQLTTQPADAVVLFDGEAIPGTSSPFVVANVTPDLPHIVEVRRTGYRAWTNQVQLAPGQTLQLPPIALVPETGMAATPTTVDPEARGGFTLGTDPQGAKVFVDGTELGTVTPVQVMDLRAGTHSLRVEYEGRAPWEGEIEIPGDQVVAIPRVVLSPVSLTATFTSSPVGAEVRLVRGNLSRPLGRTPVDASLAIGEGPWTVEMELDGHRDWSAPLGMGEGTDDVAVHAELVPLAPGERAAPRRRPARRAAQRSDPPPTVMTVAEAASTDGEAAAGGTTAEASAAVVEAPAPARASSRQGTLRLDTIPATTVIVDGRTVGTTPQNGITVDPGRHRVAFVNDQFGIRETHTIEVSAGETVTRVFTFLSD